MMPQLFVKLVLLLATSLNSTALPQFPSFRETSSIIASRPTTDAQPLLAPADVGYQAVPRSIPCTWRFVPGVATPIPTLPLLSTAMPSLPPSLESHLPPSWRFPVIATEPSFMKSPAPVAGEIHVST